jgi:DNA-binding MurR/RpiR family transcriptional regulator/pimeloyl-ACP methyl ester carboxylesterase
MAILEQPPVPGQYSGILEQIRATLPQLPPAERRIGERILTNPGQAITLSISEFAGLCGVAQPTVSKFCRSIGVSNYAALRLGLSHDFAVQSASRSSGIALAETMVTLTRLFQSTAALPVVAHTLLKASHVEIWSTSPFASTGAQLADHLMALGIPAANASVSPRWAARSAGLQQGDLVILLTVSLDETLLVALERARKAGARLLGCAIQTPRSFAQAVDWLIPLPGAPSPEMVGLALVEVLMATVQEAADLPGPDGPASPWRSWPHTRSVFLPTAGDPIPAILLTREDPPRPRPLILYFSGYNWAKEEALPGSGSVNNPICPRFIAALLNAGYHVLVVDAQAHGERKRPWEDTQTLLYESLSGKGLDVLVAARTEAPFLVDGARSLGVSGDATPIAVVGQSWGGLQALYTLAGDARIVCGVSIMPVIHIPSLIYLLERERFPSLEGMPRVVASEPGPWMAGLLAPRPLLLICGEKDEIAPARNTRRFAEAIRPSYMAAGATQHLEYMVLPNVEHEYNKRMIDETITWLARYLAPLADEKEARKAGGFDANISWNTTA